MFLLKHAKLKGFKIMNLDIYSLSKNTGLITLQKTFVKSISTQSLLMSSSKKNETGSSVTIPILNDDCLIVDLK